MPAAPKKSSDYDVLDASSPSNPTVLGDYVLLGRVGRGGMANVYRAHRLSDPSISLAIKCMRPKLAAEDRFIDMFNREAKIALLLNHEAIVHTMDTGVADGRYYIAMEYLPGHDLNMIVKQAHRTQKPLPIPHALFIASQIASALDFAHAVCSSDNRRPLNIVNRDVSPANVRLSYDGAVKLLDFGIAQAAVQVSSEIGILKGKFAYMSPEQIRGLPLDAKSDVYSLGVVLYEMLTGERLFREENEFALMERVRQAKISPPSKVNQRLPAELDELVLAMVNRQPTLRPHASGVVESLRPFLTSYQFCPSELGEYVRGLFPNEYQAYRAGEAPEEPKQEPDLAAKPASQPPRKRRPRRTPGLKPKRVRSAGRTWIVPMALALLSIGVLLLVVVLFI